MDSSEQVRIGLGSAVSGPGGALESADRLCHACVDLLDVDGASISFVDQGATRGTFGSSNELSRRLDELQFTFGEGPCLDAVRLGVPVVAPDLADPKEHRWPAFSQAVLESGVRAVCALPVAIAASEVGALDMFRLTDGPFSDDSLMGGLWAAKLAALPLLDLMAEDLDGGADDHGADGWSELVTLERVEVYQATGMVMARLNIGATEALVRLRAYAFAHDLTASEVGWGIIERRISLEDDDWTDGPGTS